MDFMGYFTLGVIVIGTIIAAIVVWRKRAAMSPDKRVIVFVITSRESWL
jgi:hypothetical protein